MTVISPLGAMAGQPLQAQSPKLVEAAHEFEAALMKEFLAPLEQDSLFSEPGDGTDPGSGSEGTLMSFGSEAMAKAISERGGFGIATRILNHFQEAAKGKGIAAEE